MSTTNTQHTPGPWTVTDESRTPQAYSSWHLKGYDGISIAVLNDNKKRQANARLIAAAPEMLSTLRAIKALADGEYDQVDLDAKGPLMIDTLANIYMWTEHAIAQAEGA